MKIFQVIAMYIFIQHHRNTDVSRAAREGRGIRYSYWPGMMALFGYLHVIHKCHLSLPNDEGKLDVVGA